jgi:hypothetical protein
MWASRVQEQEGSCTLLRSQLERAEGERRTLELRLQHDAGGPPRGGAEAAGQLRTLQEQLAFKEQEVQDAHHVFFSFPLGFSETTSYLRFLKPYTSSFSEITCLPWISRTHDKRTFLFLLHDAWRCLRCNNVLCVCSRTKHVLPSTSGI